MNVETEKVEQAPAVVGESPPVIQAPVDWHLFVQIEKVDAEQRIVAGYATAAVVDRQDDFISMAAAEQAFPAFINECGGAVREMHQPKAVGKVVSWRADREKQAIYVECYISKTQDGEDALTKVKEGILKGFSIGGRAESWTTKAMNGKTVRELTKITIRELSLVDVPANPAAKIVLWKFDMVEPEPTPQAATAPVETQPKNEGTPNVFLNILGSVSDVASLIKQVWPNRNYGAATQGASEVQLLVGKEPQTTQTLAGTVEQSGVSTVPTEQRLEDNHPAREVLTSQAAPVAPTKATEADAVGVADPKPASLPAQLDQNANPRLMKAIDDAPNYGPAKPGQGTCSNCAYFKRLGNAPYCTKYHFAADPGYRCDSWAKEPEEKYVTADLMLYEAMTDAERQKADEETEIYAKRAGISSKEGEPKTPPKGYPTDRSQYADPANYSWPCDNKKRCISAVAYYNAGKGKDKYSRQEWFTLGRRIARMASAKTGFQYKYDPRSQQIKRADKDKGGSMDKQMVSDLKNLVESAQKAAERGENVDDFLTQMASSLEIAEDADAQTVKGDMATSGGTPTAPTTAGTHPGAKPGKMKETASAPTAPTKEKGLMSTDNDPRAVMGQQAAVADGSQAVADPVPGNAGPMRTAPGTRAEAGPVGSGAAVQTATEAKAVAAQTPPKDSPDSSPDSSPSDNGKSTPGKVTPASKESDTQKGDATMNGEPVSTTPPAVPTMFAPIDRAAQNLPAFMAALEGGSLKKAQEIAEYDQGLFDEMFHKACRTLLTQGGWTLNNIQKLGAYFGGMDPRGDDNNIKKAIVSTDIPGLYLQRLAKLILPVYAGLRRRLPAQTPPIGATLAQWRAELGFQNFSFAQALYNVPEASGTIGSTTGIGQQVNESFLLFQAPFKRIALNDAVTLEAIAATRGYDDPLQVSVIRALTALIISEERKILGDNSAALPAMGTVTTALAAGGSLVSGTTYTVKVSALTYIGYLLSTVAGFTGAAAAGETAVAAGSGLAATTANGTITTTWASVKGAVAYNVYVFNGTNERYYSTVTLPTVSVTSMPGAGSAGPTADNSANANGYEGVISWAMRPTVYSQAIPNKSWIDQAGAALTSYAGGIVEFDTVLQQLWTNWQIAPSLILTSPRGAKHLTKQILSTNNPAIYRLEVSQERGTISGGAFVTGYVNKFAPYADGTPRVVDVMAHPYAVDDGYYFVTESINYPLAREARGFALDIIIPYTYFPLAQTTIHYPFAMLTSETLECYHPSAQAAIQGVNTNA